MKIRIPVDIRQPFQSPWQMPELAKIAGEIALISQQIDLQFNPDWSSPTANKSWSDAITAAVLRIMANHPIHEWASIRKAQADLHARISAHWLANGLWKQLIQIKAIRSMSFGQPGDHEQLAQAFLSAARLSCGNPLKLSSIKSLRTYYTRLCEQMTDPQWVGPHLRTAYQRCYKGIPEALDAQLAATDTQLIWA